MLLVVAVTMGLRGTNSSAASADPLVMRAGDGEGGYAVNAFLPRTITVAAGMTVRWQFPWHEPHTVTFGTVQSGAPPSTPSNAEYRGEGLHTSDLLFGPGPEYEIIFTEPGVYEYSCVEHPAMRGVVEVVAPGQPADTQADVDARSTEEYRQAVGALIDITATWRDRAVERATLPDGTTEHVVYIAGETADGDVQQYFPPQLTVTEGDTVRWRSVTVTGHTVTFGPFPEGVPRPGNPLVDGVVKPPDDYLGTGYWNSGVLGRDWSAGVEFSMRFGAPGRFAYYCIPHIEQGMAGSIEVVARSTGPVAPAPPDTGSGSARSGRPALFLLSAGSLATIASVCLLGAAVAMRRRG